MPSKCNESAFSKIGCFIQYNTNKNNNNSKTPIKKARKAYVIGGGNVAMDAVRSLKRLGIDAHIMYRRSLEELPARKMEVEHAMEEEIVFDLLENPVRILTLYFLM